MLSCKMSTAAKVLLLLCASLVAAQEVTTPEPSDDGLTQTDYIIIGVTAGVGGIVIIGGIAFACVHRNRAKKERDNKYHEYLNKKIDFPSQSHDNMGYASSTQQLAVNSGYQDPVNVHPHYQPNPYHPGVSSIRIPAVPSAGSIGYDPTPAPNYPSLHEETPANIYNVPTEYNQPTQQAPKVPAYNPAPAAPSQAPAVQPAPVQTAYQPAVPKPAPPATTQSYTITPEPTTQPAYVPVAVNPTPAPVNPTPAPVAATPVKAATPPPSPKDERPTSIQSFPEDIYANHGYSRDGFYLQSEASDNTDEGVTEF